MTRPLRRSLLLLFLLAGAGTLSACLPDETSPAPATRTPSPEPRPAPVPLTDLVLRPFTEQVLTLAWNGSYDFLVAAAPDQYIELVAMQEGVDVVLELYRPDNTLETRVDSPNRRQGPEPLPLIGSAKGPYKLTLRGGDRSPIVGQVRLQVRAARPPTDRDRMRVEAEREFAIGEETRRGRGSHSLAEAPQHYERALALTRRVEDEYREADVLLGWGKLERSRENFRVAKESLEVSRRKLTGQERPAEHAICLGELGLATHYLGDPGSALELFLQAEKAALTQGDHEGAAIHRRSYGLALRELGRSEAAMDSFRLALRLHEVAGDWPEKGVTHVAIGEEYRVRAQFDLAKDNLTLALSLLKAPGFKLRHAEALASLGWVHFLKGEAELGASQLEEALSVQRTGASQRTRTITLMQLGLLRESVGDLAKADDAFAEAIRLSAATESTETQALAIAYQSHVALKSKDFARAESGFRRSLELASSLKSTKARAAGHFGLALTLDQRGDLEAALTQMEAAIRNHEEQRQDLLSPESRTSGFAFRQPTYTLYIDLLMRLHRNFPNKNYDTRAFEASERSKARGLLDDLKLPPWALRQTAAKESLTEEARIAWAINEAAVRRKSRRPEDSSVAAASARELRALISEAGHIEARLRSSSSEFRLRGSARALTLEELRRQALRDSTILLEYSLGEDRSYLWVVSQGDFETHELLPRSVLESAARDLLDALGASNHPLRNSTLKSEIDRTRALFLGKAVEMIRGKSIIVVAEGDLLLVPFAALLASSESGELQAQLMADGTSAGFIPEVSFAPSASAIAYLLERGKRRRRPSMEIVAIGDAVYGAEDERTISLEDAPHALTGALPVKTPALRERLAYTREEVKKLLAHFPPTSRLGLVGFEASRNTVLSIDLSTFRIIHFSSHALFDSEFPELSAIVLSEVDEDGVQLDGLLRSHEMRRLHIACDLAVVSGCSSGRGKKIRGEGAVGLASSLLSAGAQQVLVSLWEVDDRATAELMTRFYSYLRVQRVSAASALAQAQFSVAQEPGWRSPYYWAGFLLVGSPEVRQHESSTKPLRGL